MKNVKRGEIYYADLSPVIGSEQDGTRPVLILQNDVGNRFSPTTIVAPITSVQKKQAQPTHIVIDCEFLESKFGQLSHEDILQINKAMAVSLGMRGEWHE